MRIEGRWELPLSVQGDTDPCRVPVGRGQVDPAVSAARSDPSEPWLDATSGVMQSGCGQHLLVVAGLVHAVYNRQAIAPVSLADRIVQHGLRNVLEQIDGAFVLAHWDRSRRRLALARDPAGQRPLYYGWADGALVFASSLAVLRSHPGVDHRVDRGALALFLRHGYVPAPHCIHPGVFKLVPGSVLEFDERTVRAGPRCHVPGVDQRRYWDVRDRYARAVQQRAVMSPAVAGTALDAHLHGAVAAAGANGRTGAFLSGGTDSSLVTAILQAQSEGPVHTLGVGFESSAHDERHWMQAVALHLGVRHETVVFSADAVLEQVQRIPEVWDEPFADASQLPTLLASKALSARCAVALTGDGGDELFCGHGAYVRAMRNARLDAWVPAPLRAWAERRHRRDPEASRLGGVPAVIAEMAGNGIGHHYLMRVGRWRDPLALLPGAMEPRTLYGDDPPSLPGADTADLVQYLDFAMELSNGILTKVECAASACGLQAVSPLLDRRVAEFAWQLPTSLKLQGREQKWILKKLLSRYLPAPLVYRPKRGFGPPITGWLRGPLREWAEALLTASNLQRAGIDDDGRIARMWAQFQGGQRRWHPQLWTLLMYLAWHQRVCGGNQP